MSRYWQGIYKRTMEIIGLRNGKYRSSGREWSTVSDIKAECHEQENPYRNRTDRACLS